MTVDLTTMTDTDLAALVKQAAVETDKRAKATTARTVVDKALADYATATGLTLVAAWKRIAPDGATVDPAPTPAAPDWKQPMAGSEYKNGDRVTYKGAVYESLINKNGWSPDAYPAGWQKIV